VLLRSGIGSEQGLPVGENLCDHVGVGMGWEPTDELREAMARFESEHRLAMAQVTIAMSDLFLFPAAEPGNEISAAVFAMKPRSRGRVSLSSDDPRAPLVVDHGFLSDEADIRVLAEGFERLRELARAQPIQRYAARETRPGEDVAAERHVCTTAHGFFHPTGTCSLGKVVDERGRLYGYSGLVVADASIMPTIPRANTNLTTAAIAEKLAETI
jgi:choline dehydrogenase